MNRDPLTDAIFGKERESEEVESVFVREDEIDALTEAIFTRLDSANTISAELAGLDRREEPLTREAILREIEGVTDAELAAFERQFITRPLPKRHRPQAPLETRSLTRIEPTATLPSDELLRAEQDWFQVRSAKEPVLPVFRAERRVSRRTIVVIILLGLLIMAGLAAAVGGDFFSGPARPGSPKFQSSFMLLNSEREVVFGPVVELLVELERFQEQLLDRASNEPRRKKEFLEAAEEAGRVQEILDEFFTANQNFSWLNAFRGLLPSSPQLLDRLAEAINQTEALTYEYNAGLNLSPRELRQYLGWLRFWERMLARDGRYLVVARPQTWAVLEISNGRIAVHSSGRLNELNAALNTKIIPPPAVQVAKTNFDFFATGWFLDSRTESEILARIFSSTTQTNVDGVVIVHHDLIEELGRGLGFALESGGGEWLHNLLAVLERATDWRGFERMLKSAFLNHGLNLFFKDRELEAFAEKEELAQLLKLKTGEDGVAVNFYSGEGEMEIEAVEYSPEFFVDGSIVSTLSVKVRNLEPRSVYLKLYLPLGSTVLEESGFGPKQTPPAFDYAGQGFEALRELIVLPADSKKFTHLDFYEEEKFLAVSGWVNVAAGRSGTVKLQYRLPWRLNWRNSRDTYQLKVIKPRHLSELAFRFQTPLNKEVGFEWIQPQGTITDSSAEYQATLQEDTTFQARITFDNF